VILVQMRFVVGEGGDDSKRSEPHTVNAWHSRSEVGLGALLSNSAPLQVIRAWHTRFEVRVGGEISNSEARQGVFSAQIRFEGEETDVYTSATREELKA
jgi:hypothetical protein